ncbi:MAG TPA: 5'/3'-nucleotidase SurE [Pirellulaceae bacterium]|nr:5'/3'-nucleotidase SurE [Pirellulaceae bacterium]HMO91512.1 5'/3'-nucleotidase SurE [Pirellulaceae bacterium]HMP71372.1 5'/3'-nucleotidase SurE [Pirellulaceae bacterium]
MKILLTNDDGINAPGLSALANIARKFGEVHIVAPKRQHSGCGHQVTFHNAIEYGEMEPNVYWIDGTPADCVRLATSELIGDVDWVISGINQGSNLGNDVFMSGTVAAAREAAWLEIPSIALSQYHPPSNHHHWGWSERLAKFVLEKFLQEKPQRYRFWSINFPALPTDGSTDIPSIRVCDLDPTPIKPEYRPDGRAYLMANDYHARPRLAGRDVDVCFSGEISVTLI